MNIMRQVAANYGKRLEQPFKIKAPTAIVVKLAEDGLWYQDAALEGVWYRSESLLVKLITGQAEVIK